MRCVSRNAGLASLLVTVWLAAPAPAQTGYTRPPTVPYTRPTTSPYLNIQRPGNRALNYYNLTRPEFEFRNAYQGLQRQVTQQATTLREVAAEDTLPATGHTTSYLNFSHYYPGLGAGAGGRGVSRLQTPAVSGARPPTPAGARTPRAAAVPGR
jgi:hypothetical protein